MANYDIKGVLMWALSKQLKGEKIFMFEENGQTWYVDNYCARAVPTPQATPGLARNTLALIDREYDTELRDTGTSRVLTIKPKRSVCIWRTESGIEVGVRDDYAKMIGAGTLYAAEKDPAEKALVVRDRGVPTTVMMPVKIRKEGER